MKQVKRGLVVGFFIIGLVSCSHRPPPVCSAAGLQQVSTWVQKTGGQWVELGDQVLIDIPTSYLFEGNSSNFYPQGQELLNAVAERLACYTTESIQVKAYTGTLDSAVNKALSAQRARAVTDDLLSLGVSRLVYQDSFSQGSRCINCRLNRIEIVTNRLS